MSSPAVAVKRSSSPQPVIKIVFILRSLDRGGSERQLVTLIKALDKTRYDVTVMTFYSGGGFVQEIVDTGVRYVSLEKRGRFDIFRFFFRFVRHLRRLRPELIHGSLDISNLLSLTSRLFLPRPVITWRIGTSDIDLIRYDWLRRLAALLERLCAQFADGIIVNSNAGLAYLLKQGFPAEKLTVIQNGIDTDYFYPDRDAGQQLRREWGLAENVRLIGLVGRLDPVKDHPMFLRAASLLLERQGDVHFVCVGSGAEKYKRKLQGLAEELSLTTSVYWAGARSDMRAVYNALDICVSSSQSESLPNVLCEAMACAVPCVATDVGDSALIIGDTGFISPPLDAAALAANLTACLDSDRNLLGTKARLRIQENWSTERLLERTERAIACATVTTDKDPA